MHVKSFGFGLLAGALVAPDVVLAAEDANQHTVSTNLAIHSQYVFRGLTQTHQDPALQGGVDYVNPSGLYAGTWLSNASWFSDTNPGNSNSLEWDFYAGFRSSWPNGITADVGYARYQYPGEFRALPAGTVKPNTDEAYAAVGWRWALLKYSYGFSDLFGVEDSEGTDYLDLTITVPLNEALSLTAHAGRQKFKGASTGARLAGTTNDALYSYEDYRGTLTYTFAQGWSALATYTHTNARDAGYTVLGENLGDDQFVVGVVRTF
jgi:uncharacterized protein (TIGR02001 family)